MWTYKVLFLGSQLHSSKTIRDYSEIKPFFIKSLLRCDWRVCGHYNWHHCGSCWRGSGAGCCDTDSVQGQTELPEEITWELWLWSMEVKNCREVTVKAKGKRRQARVRLHFQELTSVHEKLHQWTVRHLAHPISWMIIYDYIHKQFHWPPNTEEQEQLSYELFSFMSLQWWACMHIYIFLSSWTISKYLDFRMKDEKLFWFMLL